MSTTPGVHHVTTRTMGDGRLSYNIEAGDRITATVYTGEADARLYAAAPALRDALAELLHSEESPHSETVRYLAREAAREALDALKG